MDANRVTQFSDLALRLVGNKLGSEKGFSLMLNGAGEHMWERHKDLRDHVEFAANKKPPRQGMEKSFVEYLKTLDGKKLKELNDKKGEDKTVGVFFRGGVLASADVYAAMRINVRRKK